VAYFFVGGRFFMGFPPLLFFDIFRLEYLNDGV
jgi:hypothetical protein